MTTPAPSTGRPARFGPVTVAPLVAVEAVAAALLFIDGLTWPYAAGITAAAGVLAFGRTRGVLWYVRLARWSRLLRRRRADRRRPVETADLAPVREYRTVTERGMSLGVAFDGTGWFAGLAVDGDEAPHLSFAALAGILLGSGAPVSSVQLVTQTVPALPPPDEDGDGEDEDDSIRVEWRFGGAEDDTQVLDALPLFARRDSWFLVRLDVRGAARVAAERGGGAVGVQRALGGTVGRLMKGAKQSGLTLRPLDAAGLADAVRTSLGAASVAPDERGEITEDWRTWRLGGLEQAVFTLYGKVPGPEELSRLWSEAADLPARFCAVSISLRRAGDRPLEKRLSARCLIRLAAAHDDLPGLTERLTALARDGGVRLRRSNGRQGPASYASATGGGVW